MAVVGEWTVLTELKIIDTVLGDEQFQQLKENGLVSNPDRRVSGILTYTLLSNRNKK